MLTVIIDDHGAIADIQRHLDRLTRALESDQQRRPVLAAAAAELRSVEEELFASGGASGAHGRWEYTPAEARYAAFRRRLGLGDTPLVWPRGDLVASLTERRHRDHIEQIRGAQLTFGTRHPVTRRRRISKPFRRRGHDDRVPERHLVDLTQRQAQRVIDAATDEWRRQCDRVTPRDWGKA